MDTIKELIADRPVVIFSKTTCCMCHTIKILFSDFGVNSSIYELDEMSSGKGIEQTLKSLGTTSLPAVFIGGELVGGANEVMSLHLNRTLLPKLRRAGAIWV